ncbi:prolyl oligopeptidase family serine peptidase [Thalassotalea psychrophila]|uniref:Prolyl oligopeptidase family serine peptidase n=1 Tax=Thalassotalea psychrophila TaxID=3065647 RepID=A0ABY9TWH8_9GAMM|nr:prolyl oligopeptidase family serine peptidase [Colwelliaceae bacterium SQ149]
MNLSLTKTLSKTALVLSFAFAIIPNLNAEQRPLEVTDIMKFKQIVKPQLSDDGKWLAYSAQPDRGENSFHLKATTSATEYQIEHGSKGVISVDGRFAAITITPTLMAKEQADKKAKKKLKNNLEIITLASGARVTFNNVEAFQLSDRFGYVAFLSEMPKAEDKDETEITTDTDKSDEIDEKDETKLFNAKRINKSLTLVNLETGEQQVIENVDGFSFSKKTPSLVYSISTQDGVENSLKALNVKTNKASNLVSKANTSFNGFSWNEESNKVAFLQGDFSQEKDERTHTVKIWQSNNNKIKTIKTNDKQAASWYVPQTNKLTWSLDDERLFFGFKPVVEKLAKIDTKPESIDDLYNIEKLTEGRNLQIWHGEDPLIKTNEKYQLGKDKKSFFTAVYHVDDNKLVRLADQKLISVKASNNEHAVIAKTDLNYRKLRTWEGFFSDIYIVDLDNGKKSLVANKLSSYTDVKLSESGRFAAFYENENVWVYDRSKNKKRNITKGLPVSFADEDHDYPSKVPGYGIAGWLKDDDGILVYDKFDIWLLQTDGDDAKCLTCEMGRPNSLQFRINKLDDEQDYFKDDQRLLLTSYSDEMKNFGFYRLNLENSKLTKLLEENKKFKFIAKAKKADKLLYTQEDFNEFPDVWVADLNLANTKKLTNVNPQKDEFLWGQSELVEWRSNMGVKHQGVLIKPANYVEGMQYPVVVYYYRRFSQRMYEFNAMKVNHRPNFPFYTSNGYAVFLPDVHFEVGTPGHSTNKSILPGLQKIIDMGVADPKAIGLHGHSWSGYQTLHAITETDIFAAAVSGAPVSNMTSAYSGIRLGTGLARQFQYEQGQSRIGASLFERRDLYIENSPVFFADRITTPLLMQFGDIDDAVPWQQGVEMYMAMRRLEKNVILLQYEGEPHHLKKYPNKVDYTIKMKQYFDHYLKGAPAAKWMVEGEAYRERK